uniref:Uncharacterized protein n=1 Tax=Strigops habroptila TaxID=2489341 RepID=A0A672UWN6_STRHB
DLSACRTFSSEGVQCCGYIVFWAAGLTMFIIGLWARVFLGSYLELSANSSPSAPAILLATGTVVIIWGFLGCFGAATEHRGLLRAYRMADALDALQRSLSCCGVQSYQDWLTTPWGLEQNGSVPFSCCQARQGCHRSPPDTRGLHHDGCFPKVLAFVSSNMFYIASAALGLALLQLIGIVLACLLAAHIPAHLMGIATLTQGLSCHWGLLGGLPSGMNPTAERCPTSAVCRFEQSGCHGCFSCCAVSDADLYLKMELQLQVQLPPSVHPCTCSQGIAGYAFAGLRRA